ncbi:hypothetical protein D3C83_17620 [compost metagenome]
MEDAVRMFAAVQLLVIGLSHLLRPQAWIDWFAALKAWGTNGAFANGFLCLLFGSVIVAFHNVWTGVPMILTVIGWTQVIKALVAFTLPEVSLRGFGRARRPAQFRVAGVLCIAFSGLLLKVLIIG